MWYTYLATLLTKAALPIAGAALAVVLSLSAALWWTSGRLSDARDRLSQAQADTLTCIAANDSQRETIDALQEAQRFNQRQREAAISRQREALARIAELEQVDRDAEIRTIREEADGDACANARLPDALRLRISPGSD